MKKYPTVKIAFLDLNKVISLKILDTDDLEVIDKLLMVKLGKKQEFNISSYVEMLVVFLIENGPSFLEKFKDDTEDSKIHFLYSCYTGIIGYYPNFRLETFLSKINKTVFKNFPDKPIPAPSYRKRGDFRDDDDDELDSLAYANEENMKAKKGRLIYTKEQIKDLELFLKSNIIGQDQAIENLLNGVKLVCTGFANKLSFFFLGPTGVGKTQLAKLFAEKYCNRLYKIDCGEFSSGHEFHKLIGSPPGYIGHSDSNILKTKAKESDTWVFIFDEIEKASPKFFDFLLSWVESGTVTDNSGNILDFSNSILIFTSNEGIRDLKTESSLGFKENQITYDNSQEEITKAVNKKFSPEFRNRLDFIIFFNSLKTEDIRKIASLELEKQVPVVITDPLISFVVDNAYSKKYGAREIQRFIRKEISLKVAEVQLDNRIPKDGKQLYSVQVNGQSIEIVDTEENNVDSSKKTPKRAGSSTEAEPKKRARRARKPKKPEPEPGKEEEATKPKQ